MSTDHPNQPGSEGEPPVFEPVPSDRPPVSDEPVGAERAAEPEARDPVGGAQGDAAPPLEEFPPPDPPLEWDAPAEPEPPAYGGEPDDTGPPAYGGEPADQPVAEPSAADPSNIPGRSRLFPQLPDDPRIVAADEAFEQALGPQPVQQPPVEPQPAAQPASQPAPPQQAAPSQPAAPQAAQQGAPAGAAPGWAETQAFSGDVTGEAAHWRADSRDYGDAAVVGDNLMPASRGAGRNLPLAIFAGLVMGGVFFAALSIGRAVLVGLLCLVMVLGAAELYGVARKHGYRPASLLGLVTIVALACAAYWKGIDAYPVVIALLVGTGLCWFVFGVEHENPVANFSITLTGVLWIGGLGSFAALLLRQPEGDSVVIAAVVGTVAYDVLGYAIGRTTGQTRLSNRISPSKTVEGLIAGVVLSALATAVVVNRFPGIHPWTTNAVDSVILAVAIACAAPLGDLAQSLAKRDLGVKDMGTLLPGHGGVLDRFDALLFALPAAYLVSTYALS